MVTCGCVVLFSLGMISLTLSTASLVGNEWIRIHYPSVTYQKGLWVDCVDDVCIDLGDKVSRFYLIVRSTVVLSILLTLFGSVLSLVRIKVEKFNGVCISCFFLFAVICMVVGLFLFISENTPSMSNRQFGWCYICGWIAVVFQLASFLFGLCMERF